MNKFTIDDAENLGVEEIMDICDYDEEIAMEDYDCRLVVTSHCFYIEDLDLTIRDGTFLNYDEEFDEFMPDFSVTVIYKGRELDPTNYDYWEQDGFVVSLHNYLYASKMLVTNIAEMECELIAVHPY